MSDTERELDAALATAEAATRTSKRLAGEAEQAARATAEWKKNHGIDEALQTRFFNALSPEDRKKADDEQEAFARELVGKYVESTDGG